MLCVMRAMLCVMRVEVVGVSGSSENVNPDPVCQGQGLTCKS